MDEANRGNARPEGMPTSDRRQRRNRRRAPRPARSGGATAFDAEESRPAPSVRRGPAHGDQPSPPSERCVRMAVVVPTTWPVASRRHVAVARLRIVDRRDDAVLMCDGLHDGPHFWPDDEPSPPIWDAELDASLDEPPQGETDAGPEVTSEDEQAAESPLAQ